ncbi:MAG: hypothetical protein H6981_11540 [Gammaproteobacteria bacterium]|nr:hypothetical protein [Gammaproteobacteria bacterium]MCP5137420.1 hypothetical protein [Gammaproteobacteria bacterium]
MPKLIRLFARLCLALSLILAPLAPGQLTLAGSGDTVMRVSTSGASSAHHGCAHASHTGHQAAAPCCCDRVGDESSQHGCCGGQCGGHCASSGHGMAALPMVRLDVATPTQNPITFLSAYFPDANPTPAFRPPIR